MINYRRNFVPGDTYFFTVALRNRQSRQLTQSIDLLRQAFRDTLRSQPFQIDAIVILPDHLHSIWTLPPGDSDYPARWKAIIKLQPPNRKIRYSSRKTSRRQHARLAAPLLGAYDSG
ncbi:hypothetical protein [Methylomicrobium sp. Wu6]|uniref:REP-associated tyrosine transposase n=1 Tax=Methylomicrobium sp. Wu6 TaxID=3107928 RepID=UPI002DD69841|nr:hypothetical protein [Methylomicrobium sp. Wu6]MEC4747663.1 hypothetical protein [Methylomicrobium sp. Wu6]